MTLNLSMKMKIDKKNRQIDQANMNDLVQTFQKRNEEALKKKRVALKSGHPSSRHAPISSQVQ